MSDIFDLGRTEIAGRIMEGKRFLATASSRTTEHRDESATCRGLLFVQLYGIYEYSVRTAVQGGLEAIRRDGLSCTDVRRSLLSLVLDRQWKSASTSGRERVWETRCDLIYRMTSASPLLDLDNTLFPSDGSHYRVRQLYSIWMLFGISSPIVPEPRLQGRIEEIVDSRNAISHGRQTAYEVGQRHSHSDMEHRINDIETIVSHVIDTMDQHCVDGLKEPRTPVSSGHGE